MTESEIITEFIAKPSKSGDHYLFTIPKKLIDVGIIEMKSNYILQIKKINNSN